MATTGTCACYFCDGYPVWQIWLGEDERPEATYACGVHARGHLRRAMTSSPGLPIPDDAPITVRDNAPPAIEAGWRV